MPTQQNANASKKHHYSENPCGLPAAKRKRVSLQDKTSKTAPYSIFAREWTHIDFDKVCTYCGSLSHIQEICTEACSSCEKPWSIHDLQNLAPDCDASRSVMEHRILESLPENYFKNYANSQDTTTEETSLTMMVQVCSLVDSEDQPKNVTMSVPRKSAQDQDATPQILKFRGPNIEKILKVITNANHLILLNIPQQNRPVDCLDDNFDWTESDLNLIDSSLKAQDTLPSHWFTGDSIIDYFNKIVIGENNQKVSFISPHAWAPHVNSDGKYYNLTNAVGCWVTPRVMDHDVVFIVCHGHTIQHWYLIAIYPNQKTICLMDGLHASAENQNKWLSLALRFVRHNEKICTGLEMRPSEWSMNLLRCLPKQPNSYDCGPVVCIFANYIASGRELPRNEYFTQTFLDECRKRIRLAILKE